MKSAKARGTRRLWFLCACGVVLSAHPPAAGASTGRVAAVVKSVFATPGSARHVAVKDGLAAVSLGPEGVALVDAGVATNPVQAGFIPLSYPQEACRAAFVSNFLYVALWGREAWVWRTETGVYDISDPSAPVKTFSLYTNGLAWAVAAGGTRAYVGVLKLYPTYIGALPGSVVEVYDTSDPASPAHLHTLEGFQFAREVGLAGGELVVADLQGGAALVSLPDAGGSAPRRAALPGWQEGERAVFATAGGPGALYAACGEDGLWVLDASDPDHPALTNALWLPGSSRSVAVAAPLMAVAAGDEGVALLHAGDPMCPALAGWLNMDAAAESVALEGDMLYVAAGDGGLVIAQLVDDDTDGDGLSDAWERLHFESLDQAGSDDPDEDGYSNDEEQRLGTDPDDPESVLRLRPPGWQGEAFPVINWFSVGGRRYDLEYSTNLLLPGGGFMSAGQVAESAPYGAWTNRSFLHEVPLPAEASRYYRVRLAP